MNTTAPRPLHPMCLDRFTVAVELAVHTDGTTWTELWQTVEHHRTCYGLTVDDAAEVVAHLVDDAAATQYRAHHAQHNTPHPL